MCFLYVFSVLLTLPLLCSGQYNQYRKTQLLTGNYTFQFQKYTKNFSAIPAKAASVHPAFTYKAQMMIGYNLSCPATRATLPLPPYRSVFLDQALFQYRNVYMGDTTQSGTFEPLIRTAFSLITGKPY